jgi:hypothetical protein
MSDFEVPCLSDQELVEILILRLFDPGFEGYALSGLVEVILFLLSTVSFIFSFDIIF